MSNLPSGIVTFVFTDIEGSTTLWERNPAGMRIALDHHNAVLERTMSAHRGHVFKTIGDAFQVAFAEAADAVLAVAASQRALNAAEGWGEVGRLRVRMGIHVGPAEAAEEDYVPCHTLNRVARVSSAGHGGQTLLSREVVELVRDRLPDGASLRELGAFHLKGLTRPEHIFQLVISGLQNDFPQLASVDRFNAHYETVVKAIAEGRLVPFIGAGVNSYGRSAQGNWDPEQAGSLPNNDELASHLARQFNYPSNQPLELARVSQFIATMDGLGPLYDELHSLFDKDLPSSPVHQFFAGLPAAMRAKGYRVQYPLIVTTNYDDALERAFTAANESYDLVTYIAEGEQQGKFLHRTPDGDVNLIERPNEYRALKLDQRPVILKIHGAVDRAGALWDSYVITEDHYINYLARTDISNLLPFTLAAKLRKSHFLFLGYNLREWNLRVILYRIWGEQKLTYKSWAVQGKAGHIDQEFWRKREVEILNATLEDYMTMLDERVKTLPAAGGA